MQTDLVFGEIVFWVSLLGGILACIVVWRFLLRAVSLGKLGRFLATVIYGLLTCIVISAVPSMLFSFLHWMGTLAGLSLSPGQDITMGIAMAYAGFAVSLAATVLFVAVMIFKGLTGSKRLVGR